MKIGINALYLLPGRVGGSETYVRNLVKWISAIDRENEYFVFINRESVGVFDALAPNIRVVPCAVHASRRSCRILWEQLVLPFQVARHRVDVLLSAGMTAPFFCPATSVMVIFDLQHVNQPRNYHCLYLLFLRTIIYMSAKCADGLVAISNHTKKDIVRYYHLPPERIAAIHLAVDHAAFAVEDEDNVRTKYGLPDRFLLYAASTLPHKNHERLLEAYKKVRIRVPDLKLVLTGARDRGGQALLRSIQAMRLEGDVMTFGWLPFEDIPSLYRASEAFLFPSLHEGFGLPVIEAMACGVPVVCSRIEPLIEVAGDAALFVDPLDPDDIARGIITVIEDASTRGELIKKGIDRAGSFTWEKTSAQTLEFLKAKHAGKAGAP